MADGNRTSRLDPRPWFRAYQLLMSQTAIFPDAQASAPFPGASCAALPATVWMSVYPKLATPPLI